MNNSTASDRIEKILQEIREYLQSYPDAKAPEIAQSLGLNVRSTYRYLDRISIDEEIEQTDVEEVINVSKFGPDKRIIISSYQNGAEVNKEFLKNLNTFAKGLGADIVLIPLGGVSKDDVTPVELELYDIVTEDTYLNSKLHIKIVPVKAQQVLPLTGLDRFVQEGSAIIGAPKQFQKVIPTSNQKMPKVLLTTGAVTLPYYKENRSGYVAQFDHTCGALLVEIKDDEIYYYRMLAADENNQVQDITNVKSVKAIVLGDLHTGVINPTVLGTTIEMIKDLSPEYIIVHDLYDGESVNHHDRNKHLTRALKAPLSLEEELKQCGEMLENLRKVCNSKIVVVKSNHDEFLERHLDALDFRDDHHNLKIKLYLAHGFLEGHDVLKYGIEKCYGKLHPDIQLLQRDDDFKLLGWQLGSHGDLGTNGSRGSPVALERTALKAIFGHSHTPQIMRDIIVVGTSTFLKLGYNRGPSSWLNAHAVLHNNGTVQLINIIDSNYKL